MFRVVVALILIACAPCRAHELWLEPLGAGDFRLHWGHSGSGDHEGVTSLPFAAADVAEAWGATGDAEVRRLDVVPEGDGVRLPDCGAYVAVRLDAGTWVKTLRGTVRGEAGAVDGALESWRSWVTVKRIDRFDPVTARPRLEGLEISPREDPRSLRAGDKIDLRVTLGGAPVADAIVTYAGRPRGATDRDGHVRIKLRTDGVQRIGASCTVSDVDAAVDRTVYEAFLEFELGGGR